MKTINIFIIITICYLVGKMACFHTDLNQFTVGWWSAVFAVVSSVTYIVKSGMKGGEQNDINTENTN